MAGLLSLQQWVKNEGSLKSAAQRLGISPVTLGNYCRAERYPRMDKLMSLKEILSGVVDLDLLMHERLEHKKLPVKQRKRISRSNLLINKIDVLRVVYAELDLAFEEDLTSYRSIINRWKTTNVTVGEVRDAVQKLSSSGRNASDINLIHETIPSNSQREVASPGKPAGRLPASSSATLRVSGTTLASPDTHALPD